MLQIEKKLFDKLTEDRKESASMLEKTLKTPLPFIKNVAKRERRL